MKRLIAITTFDKKGILNGMEVIDCIPVLGRDYSFDSYSEFISWLTYQNDK